MLERDSRSLSLPVFLWDTLAHTHAQASAHTLIHARTDTRARTHTDTRIAIHITILCAGFSEQASEPASEQIFRIAQRENKILSAISYATNT